MSNNSKISDNPKTQQILKEVENYTKIFRLLKLVPGIRKIYPNFDELLSQLEELKKQSEIIYLPDRFNDKFSDLGWIAYESLSIDVMKKAITIAETEGMRAAELLLTNYYNEDNLKWLLMRFQGHKEFRRRLRLIELAKEDYLAERYHAFIPLILSITDGIVRDVSNHVGLFGENINLTDIDSIAAHKSGLQKLISIVGCGRGKTNEEAITIPYRHGILHGRELAFDNKIVAAKCWSMIFAIRDWAQSLAENKNSLKKEEPKSWNEIWKNLKEFQEFRQRSENWESRAWLENFDWSSYSSSEQFEENSPERTVAIIFEEWQKCRWGKLAEFVVDYRNSSPKKKQEN